MYNIIIQRAVYEIWNLILHPEKQTYDDAVQKQYAREWGN